MDREEGAGTRSRRGDRDQGLEGFGAHSRVHTAKILRLSIDLPIIIEIVDTIEKIDGVIDAAIPEGLATVEKVHVRFYRGGKE